MQTKLIYYTELINVVSKAVKKEKPLFLDDLEAQKNWLRHALPEVQAQKNVSLGWQEDIPYRDFQIPFDLTFNTKYIYPIRFRVAFRGYHPYLISEYSDTPITALASVEHLIAVITAIRNHAATYLDNGEKEEAIEIKKEKINSLKYAAIEAKMVEIAEELNLPYAIEHEKKQSEIWFKMAEKTAVQVVLNRTVVEKGHPREIIENIVEIVKQAQFWIEKDYFVKTSVKTKLTDVNWKKPQSQKKATT